MKNDAQYVDLEQECRVEFSFQRGVSVILSSAELKVMLQPRVLEAFQLQAAPSNSRCSYPKCPGNRADLNWKRSKYCCRLCRDSHYRDDIRSGKRTVIPRGPNSKNPRQKTSRQKKDCQNPECPRKPAQFLGNARKMYCSQSCGSQARRLSRIQQTQKSVQEMVLVKGDPLTAGH